MWSSGQALSIDQQLTLFDISTGQLGFSALDGDLSVSASLSAALVADISATTGGISLDYPVNATLDAPNVVAPGQNFTIDTGTDGLSAAPTFDAELPQFAASLNAMFNGGISADFDSWATGSFNLNIPLSNTIPLASVKAGGSTTVLDGLLTFTVPTDYASKQTSVGSGSLPSVTLDAQTGDIASASFDLLKIVTEIFAPEISSYFPTGSALDGALGYNLASLVLKLGAQLAQQFTFVPTGITANITAPWGQTDDVPLGQAATFTVPTDWTKPIDLSTNYELGGDLISQTGLVGQVDLNLSLLSGSFLGDSFGPLYNQDFPVLSTDPIYLLNPGGSGGFALEGFNTPGGNLSIALGTGSVTGPDGTAIDTSAFTANSTAVIQSALTAAAGAATQTNLYDPANQSGSATAVPGDLNVEVVNSSGADQLPPGFNAGIVEPDAGNAELGGNANDVLLAAAPSVGNTDTLISENEADTLVGGQDGGVDFVITSGFSGEIDGMTGNDAIVLSDIPYNSSDTVSLGADNILSVDEQRFFGFSTVATIQLHSTDDFTGETFILSPDPSGGTDIELAPIPPPPTNLKIDPSTDSSHKGTATNVKQPLIDGNGQPGYTVTLFDDGKVVGTAVVDSSGDWSIKTSPLPDGTHHFTASETAPDGAVSDPPELNLTIKSTPPVAPSGLVLDAATADVSAGNRGLTAGNDLTTFTQPTIDGTGEAGDTVELLNGTTVLGTSTIDSTGNWSITASTLAPGEYSLTAISADGANNNSPASSPFTLQVLPQPIGPTAANQSFDFSTDGQYVLGTAGNDDISGTTNNSVIDGLSGQDTIGVQGNGNLLDSGHGNDTMSAVGGDNTLDGDKGSDNLFARGADNTLKGGAGPDTIFAVGDGDTISGGNVADTITVYGQDASIIGAGGTDSIAVAGSYATIVGGTGNEFIDGSAGNQSITGGSAGNDTIWGGAGDTIGGGSGAGVTIGGVQSDILTGGSGTAFIDGDLGNQSITGGSAGNETIWGGAGDTIGGGNGASVLIGGVQGDTITGGTGTAFIDGHLGNQAITGGNAGTETMWGGAGDTIGGGSGASVTIGGVAGDTIAGGAGAAFIDGDLGGQSIVAGNGADTIWGGSGDTITAGPTGALIGFGAGNTDETFANAGNAGGIDTISDFVQSSGDRIHLASGSDPVSAVVGSAATSGGNTTITFHDGSQLTLLGVSSINASFFD